MHRPDLRAAGGFFRRGNFLCGCGRRYSVHDHAKALNGRLIFSSPLRTGRRFGAGVILGEPTGFNFKLWLGGETAVDLGVAWSFLDPNRITLQVYADFLYHFFNVFTLPAGKIVFYLGAGARVIVFNNPDNIPVNLGIRVPFGAAYFFQGVPVDVFLELVPIMEVIPATRLRASFGLGIRYFF